MRRHVAGLCVACVAFLSAAASAAEGLGHFRSHRDEGWFFYKDPKDLEKKEKPKQQVKKSPSLPKPTEKDRPKDAVKTVYSGPPPFSAAWLKVMLPRYLNRALDDPTPTMCRLI